MFNIPELARLREESDKIVSGVQSPLWSFLSSNEVIDGTANFKPPPLNSKDKTSTSLRLLLSDTQGSLEGFSAQVTTLTREIMLAKHQVEEAGKIVEDNQLRATEETKLLLSKTQNKISKSLEDVQNATKELISTTKEQHNAVLIKQDDIRQVGISLTQQLAISIQQQKELAEEQADKMEKKLLEMQQAHSKDLSQVQELVLSQKSTLISQESFVQSLVNQMQALKETVEGIAKKISHIDAPNPNAVPSNYVSYSNLSLQTQLPVHRSSPMQRIDHNTSTSPTDEWNCHRQGSFIERLAVTPRSPRMGWHTHNQLKNANSTPMTTAPNSLSRIDSDIFPRNGISNLNQGRSSSPLAPSSPTPAPATSTNSLQIPYPSPASFKRPFDSNSAQCSTTSTISTLDLIVQRPVPRHTNPMGLESFAHSGNLVVKRQLHDLTPGQGQVRKKFKRTILQD